MDEVACLNRVELERISLLSSWSLLDADFGLTLAAQKALEIVTQRAWQRKNREASVDETKLASAKLEVKSSAKAAAGKSRKGGETAAKVPAQPKIERYFAK